MLARPPTAEDVPDVDGLWDLVGACCRQAVKDFQAGPAVVGQAHYETAKTFLEVSGLMERVSQKGRKGRSDEDTIAE